MPSGVTATRRSSGLIAAPFWCAPSVRRTSRRGLTIELPLKLLHLHISAVDPIPAA